LKLGTAAARQVRRGADRVPGPWPGVWALHVDPLRPGRLTGTYPRAALCWDWLLTRDRYGT